MTTSPESPLITIFEGLLSGALSRAEAGQAAAAATLTGSRWYDHGALGALSVLDVVVPAHYPRDDPPWFINDQALRDWLVLLRGDDINRELAGGWHRIAWRKPLPHRPSQAPSTPIGFFPEPRGRYLHHTLGQPLRTNGQLAPCEGWDLLSPDGVWLFLDRYVAPTEDETAPDRFFNLYAPPNVTPATLLTALDGLIDIQPDLDQRRRYSLSLEWALWRQDDNGNEFRISRHLSEAGAERAQRWMSSFHHKQTYWTQHEPR